MKTHSKLYHSTAIINQMLSHSYYKPLRNLFYCQDFLNIMMPPTHQKLIEKIFIKNKILNIITKNPSGFQELKHDDTKKNIKFLIKMYAQKNPSSPFCEIEDIKIFSSRNFKEIPKKPIYKKNTYLELSEARFKNPFENSLLFEKFENLRKAIKKCSNKN